MIGFETGLLYKKVHDKELQCKKHCPFEQQNSSLAIYAKFWCYKATIATAEHSFSILGKLLRGQAVHIRKCRNISILALQ